MGREGERVRGRGGEREGWGLSEMAREKLVRLLICPDLTGFWR